MINKINQLFKDFNSYIHGHEKMFVSSVLVPLINKEDELCLLFQRRSYTMDAQPGEISFPGGKSEEFDKNHEETAIRETCEELGIKSENINIICPLDIFVAPFNLIINPYLGYINNIGDIDKLNINKNEVDHLFLVPIKYFLENEPKLYQTKIEVIPDKSFPYYLTPSKENYKFKSGKYDVYFYEYNDYVIWGITAKIVKNFIDIYKKFLDDKNK